MLNYQRVKTKTIEGMQLGFETHLPQPFAVNRLRPWDFSELRDRQLE